MNNKDEALRDVLEAMKGARHEIFSNRAHARKRLSAEQIDNYPPLKELEKAIAQIEALIGEPSQ